MTPIDLPAYLRELAKAGPIYYRPNPGNAGDSLIALATFRLFHRLGIEYRLADENFDPTDQLLLFGGGGSLIAKYREDTAWQVVNDAAKKARRLVILPQTVQGCSDFLSELGDRVEILCREPISYDHVKQHATRSTVYLAHDLALCLDARAFLSESHMSTSRAVAMYVEKMTWKVLGNPWGERVRQLPGIMQLKRIRAQGRQLRNMLQTTLRDAVQTGELNCFRTDKERAHDTVPANNVDLSRLLRIGVQNYTVNALICREFLEFLDAFSVIHTDRLHVTIASSLLGKEVHLHANNYYKNRAIYDHSLRTRFPNIHWCE